MTATAAILPDRSLLEIAGEERANFLQGLITNDVAGLGAGQACFAGLLSPQGKILFDFFAIDAGDTILLDCPAAAAADLLKRLTFYKLRAKVTLGNITDKWRVAAAWGEGAGEALKASASIAFGDPRLPALGFRSLIEAGASVKFNADSVGYDAMRIAAAVPEGGKDYAYGDTFPHEACFDLLNGVSFTKGCYVGQEVVSRMQHRGTARTRVLAVSAAAPLPEGGADILAEGFAVGRLGSVAGDARHRARAPGSRQRGTCEGAAAFRRRRCRDALGSGLGQLFARRRRRSGGALMAPAPEICRCPWAGSDPLYLRYHDEEWGVPKTRDIEFFEKMILEGFQSGLSWITILRKREAFRAAFDGFDAAKVAGYGDAKIAELLANAGIVRHRGKIEAAIANARAYLALSAQQSLAAFLWGFVDGEAIQNRFASIAEVPPQTPLSQKIAKELKTRGFRFTGPTTTYSLMQACGLVNDHLLSCHRHEPCAALARPRLLG